MRYLTAYFSLLLSTSIWAENLIGQWQGQVEGQRLSLQFNADGTGKLNDEAIQYATQANLLMIQTQNGTTAYQFSWQNKQLIVQGGNLVTPLMLQRSKHIENNKAATGAKANTNFLVGKWCLVKSFSANAGGGSSSNQCFVLEANGRYRYDDERSMDAYGGGMWGGKSSHSSDTGQWTATQDSMTAQSDNGSTIRYQMQLKNHPKNNEPMICLEGDCYVTYYQRASW